MDIEALRGSIDQLDAEIVKLLNRRAEVVKKLAELKNRDGQHTFVVEREQAIHERLARLNQGPLTSEGLEAIYREVLSSSRALERQLRIAYLGPAATFSHQAARSYFGSACDYVPQDDIAGVFGAVVKRQADYGVVPIESSASGAIRDTLDLFMTYEVKVCGEAVVEIHQYLLSRCELGEVERVYSKPQAFEQCRRWLALHLPGAELVAEASTARAAERASRESGAAAVASAEAAEQYRLTIRADSIEDKPYNSTRFFILGDHIAGRTGKDKTSLMFGIKDEVGTLCNILASIKEQGINLTKIESRPSRRRAWDYYFFLDMEGHVKDKPVQRALEAMQARCTFVQVLGSFPRG